MQDQISTKQHHWHMTFQKHRTLNVWSQNFPKPPFVSGQNFQILGIFVWNDPWPSGWWAQFVQTLIQLELGLLPLLNRHLPLHFDSQFPQLAKKCLLRQGALSKHGPDLHVLAKSLVGTWIWLESAQPAILSIWPPTSVTKMTKIVQFCLKHLWELSRVLKTPTSRKGKAKKWVIMQVCFIKGKTLIKIIY